MEIQARRQILEIWRAAVSYCYHDGQWRWGGRGGRNSISDAEQLLTILYPATAIESLGLGRADALEYLGSLGMPRRLVTVIGDYMRTYLLDGSPDFSGGSYFGVAEGETESITAGQRKLQVVDSYSTSVRLCLSALSFLLVYRQGLRERRIRRDVEAIEELVSQRLTAAMIGLLRSFTVYTFDPADPGGQAVPWVTRQRGIPGETAVRDLLAELGEVRAGLRKALGTGRVAEELDDPGRLFECGWSWGIVDGAAEIPYAGDAGLQPDGAAEARPYLYFTVIAFDAIAELASERTRILGLLNAEQQRLADALNMRRDLTCRFWAKLATFGTGTWLLEDLPWVTSDGRESDYYSLLLTADDADIERTGHLLEELARRSRITRRPVADDPAIALHVPGLELPLVGSEQEAGGPRLSWTVSSFALLVLKHLLRVAEMAGDTAPRIRLLDLADVMWTHIDHYEAPSWYHTERVIEVLVAAVQLTQGQSADIAGLAERARQLVAEAEHLFDLEQLHGASDPEEHLREIWQAWDAKLRRARELLGDRPGTASVLAAGVLAELDRVAAEVPASARRLGGLAGSHDIRDASVPSSISVRGEGSWQEPAGAAGAGGPPGYASGPEQRWLVADMPATVPLRAEVSLLVRVGAHPSGTGGSAPLKDFHHRPGGTKVTIIVQAPRELVPVEPLEQVLVVPADGSSEPVRFAFRADWIGLFALRVTAFAGGTYLGELVTELSVEAGGLLTNGPRRAAAMAPVRAEPGEVTLQVRFDGQRYTFQLLSESYLFEPVIARALTARPGEAVERAVATLRAMAGGGSAYTGKNARTWMEETGIGLWNDMVPDLIKEQFWQLRSSIGSFSIAGGQDTIPWELLYPLSPSADAGFLVEQFPVLRRVYGQCRTRRVSVGQPVYVVPARSPADAATEVSTLRDRLPGASAEITDLAPLLDLINAGAVGMLHFACHSTFKAEAGGSSIVMGGGPFIPGLLNRAVTTQSLAGRSPLVFLNACRSAGEIPEYTRLMGWAGQFMAAGAGAFIGTLWAVRSSSALAFAETFYEALLAGQPFGHSVQLARQATAADTSDPTWLAYTAYGDPMATAAGAANAGS